MDGVAIPKYLYGILQFIFCILVIYYAPKRFSKKKTTFVSTGVLVFFITMQVLFEYAPIQLWVLTILGMFLLMFGFVYYIAKIDVMLALYLTVQAFMYSQFTAAIDWQIYYFLGQITPINYLLMLEILIFIFVTSIFVSLLFILYTYYMKKGYQLDIKYRHLITIILITIIVFTISNISFVQINTPISSIYPKEIFYIRTLVNLCGTVVVLVLHENQMMIYAQKEISGLQNVFDKYYKQYLNSKESIALADQRYHDIKHQINLIRSESNINKKNEYLDEFEKEIKSYYINVDTGNKVIDTIITSYYNQCINIEINLYYFVDAHKIDFISTMDISSLLGNMFDNAIESLKNVTDKDNKMISLKIQNQMDFIIIEMENYYEHSLKIEKGEFQTTKYSIHEHGYGIKSITNIVKKYQGSVQINTDNKWFTITILIPLIKQ